jgi:hypothetical protein
VGFQILRGVEVEKSAAMMRPILQIPIAGSGSSEEQAYRVPPSAAADLPHQRLQFLEVDPVQGFDQFTNPGN